MILRCLVILTCYCFPYMMAAQYPRPDKQYASLEPAASSVLASGMWFKVKINKSGIYRLSYEDIAAMGFTNPENVRIYGNGGSMLPLINGDPRYDDLIENAIYMSKGTDGVFNAGDFVLFYGQGPVQWYYNPASSMFEHQMHAYSDASFYFITTKTGEGLRIVPRNTISGTPTLEINSFDDFSYHEKNKYNFLKSGRQWFSDRIDFAPFDTIFTFNGLLGTMPVKVKLNVAGRSSLTKTFTLTANSSFIGTLTTSGVNLTNKTGLHANQKSGVFNFSVTSDLINLRVAFNKTSSEDEGYIDYIIMNARRRLSLTGDVLFFRDKSVEGTGIVARYNVENSNQQTEIWDITDRFRIKKVPSELSGTKLLFTDSTTTHKEFVVLKPDAFFPKPVYSVEDTETGPIPNQDLHGMDPQQMLIITHPLFIEAADSIAEYHRQTDALPVAVVSSETVFNEFSSGAPDVSAMRDFVKLMYDRAAGENNQLKYLLLVGDGSYNNLSRHVGNANYILTYQSENSLNASFSYVSDDFFGMLEDGEGGSNNMEDYSLDLGIGRLPVKTAEEAMTLYRKIKDYHKKKGDWQNNILFAADDGDGNLHMNQANNLANWIDGNYPEFAIKKVLIDAYPQITSSLGARYPEAHRAIINNIEKGLLIFNYTGHGGELGLADEQILMREDLINLKNRHHLPLFITATCEFSRFDDLSKDEAGVISESTSAGEHSILNPQGGSIALITTTRIVYSSENHELNTRFYEVALSQDARGNNYRLGDVMKITKNVLGKSRNKLNFILLGDPALKLAIPNYKVVTDSINNASVNTPLDTLKAFSKITISGHIEDYDQNILTDYNGVIYPSVFDKKKTMTTLANDVYATPMQFSSREDLLYKGKASVINGRFTFSFLVPKDITYSYGTGRIIYYSHNSVVDANGEFSNFIIGGTDPEAEPDRTGPLISLYLNDPYFKNEGITNSNPVIYAEIEDESGINTIGNGIGHDITGVIDGNVAYPIVMNDYFETHLDNNSAGILRYPMENLSLGTHSLRLKVWDVFNNSSEATIEFMVITGDKIVISKTGNYPNPASDHTTFVFEHNQPDKELKVNITVYDLGGRLLFDYSENIFTSGFNSSPPVWDLKDLNGNQLKSGIYPYRIRISDGKGSYSDSFQKLVVIR